MANVTERWQNKKLSKSGGGWRLVRIFDVTEVDSEKDAIDAVEAHDDTTAFNASPDESDLMYCSDRDGDQAGFRFWTVTITYSSSPEGRFFDHGNPLNEPTKWRVVPATEQTASSVDAYGFPIMNAAGQAFSTDPPAFQRFITLVGQRVEPYFNLQQAIQFTNAVNNVGVSFDGTWSLEKGQVCVRSIQPVSTITGAEPYVIVEYVIEIRQGDEDGPDDDGFFDGFKLRILNDGTEGFYDDGGVTKVGPLCRLVADPNNPSRSLPDKVSYPVLLDSDGIPLDSGIYVMVPPSVNTQGYATPVESDFLTFGTIAGTFEFTGFAWFVKVFPKGIQFRNIADLGL